MTPQDIQTPSHFVNEEIVEMLLTTTYNVSISTIHPTFTTPHRKNNTPFSPTTIKSAFKRTVVPKFSHIDYETNRSITTKHPSNKPKFTEGKSFANHNYDFFTNNNINNPMARRFATTHNQSHDHNHTQQVL